MTMGIEKMLLALALALAVLPAAAQSHAAGPGAWAAPTYHGLRVGTSTGAQVLRAFGRPRWSGTPETPIASRGRRQVVYEYTNVAGLAGRTSVFVDAASGRVRAILLYPERMTGEQARERFGADYVERAESQGVCGAPAAHGAAHRRGEGTVFRVYRQKGTYVTVQPDGKVLEVGLVASCP